MIKKLLMKDKFKNLDKDNRAEKGTFFELLLKILSEPEMQKVFGGRIGFSHEGIKILDNDNSGQRLKEWWLMKYM